MAQPMSRHGEAKWRADAKQAATAQRHIRETQLGLRRYRQIKRQRKPSLWARLKSLFV